MLSSVVWHYDWFKRGICKNQYPHIPIWGLRVRVLELYIARAEVERTLSFPRSLDYDDLWEMTISIVGTFTSYRQLQMLSSNHFWSSSSTSRLGWPYKRATRMVHIIIVILIPKIHRKDVWYMYMLASRVNTRVQQLY